MSSLSGLRRRLNPQKVYLAAKVADKKIELAKQVVLERAQKDAEFASDVLKAVGENLPSNIKDACEKCIADSKLKPLVDKWEKTGLLDRTSNDLPQSILIPSEEHPSLDDVSLGDGFVAVQRDGGGQEIISETQLPEYPHDGK